MVMLPGLAATEIYCTVKRRWVRVRFLSYDGRHPLGVVWCSAFPDGDRLTCGTPCVADPAWPAADDPKC